MNLPQRQHEFLLTPNANLHMRPLTYCLLSTLLFGLPFSAFMNMLISYRRLWAVLSVVVICLTIFLASIITVISNAKKRLCQASLKQNDDG